MSKKKEKLPAENEASLNKVDVDSAISIDESEKDLTDIDPVEALEKDLTDIDPVEALEKDLQETKDALAEQKDKFVRLQAETDNFRIRLSREKEEFLQYANERLLKALIPIFDNFERALEDPSNDTKSLKEGLDMILKQFSSFLEKEKVAPIKSIGEKFDPAIHEVLTSEESDDHEEDIIISQFAKGYTINNRVLRPSQVVISKKSLVESEEKPDEEENTTN